LFRIDKNSVRISPDGSGSGGAGAFYAGSAERRVISGVVAATAEAQRIIDGAVKTAEDEAAAITDGANVRAEEIISSAADKAKFVLDSAEAEAERIKLAAREKGFADGYEDGLKQAEVELAAQKSENEAAFLNILGEIKTAKTRELEALEPKIIELIFEMVKKIINLSAKSDDNIFETMICGALTKIGAEGTVTVRVSADDAERFFPKGSAVFDLDGQRVTAKILPDPTMNEFDCVIDSSAATVNAGLDSQLRYLRIAFGEAGAAV